MIGSELPVGSCASGWRAGGLVWVCGTNLTLLEFCGGLVRPSWHGIPLWLGYDHTC